MTDEQIDKAIKRYNKLASRRDGRVNNPALDEIAAQLATVPAGTRNDVDLLLHRSCAQLPERPAYGAQPAPDDYRIANRPNNPNWHGVAAWFDEAAHVDPGALFAASLSPQLAADVEAVREGWFPNQPITNAQAAPVAQKRRDEYLDWLEHWKDQTADFAANMAQYGAEIDDAELSAAEIIDLEARTAETANEPPEYDGMWK